jgi:hypothetical protein
MKDQLGTKPGLLPGEPASEKQHQSNLMMRLQVRIAGRDCGSLIFSV